MTQLSDYFTDKELACKCCGKIKLASGFADDLIDLRLACGHPLRVNSCCRCKMHNEVVGGRPGSFHQMDNEAATKVKGCCAIDISIAGWAATKTWRFVRLAMDKGWSIGINWNLKFIHLDRRIDHATGWDEPAMFSY